MNDGSNLNTLAPQWLGDRNFVAIVLREYLRPIDGYDSPIFPPTFAMKGALQRCPYNIDPLSNGDRNICLIDSIPSQSNRLEPIFDEFSPRIVRKVTVEFGKNEPPVSLLKVGHRVADAAVRFSDKAKDVAKALAEHEIGNSSKLAKDYATSLLFGAWNSREEGEKVKRLLQSSIRATNVDVLTRASQYVPPVNYKELVDEDNEPLIDPKMKADKLSKQGLLPVPVVLMPTKEKNKDLAFRVHGGIIVNGDLRHDASINLINLRAIRAGDEPKQTEKLRNYLFGLSLAALLYPQDYNLRQGCQLVLDQEKWEKHQIKNADAKFGKFKLAIVSRNGSEVELNIDYSEAEKFAQQAAKQFEISQTPLILKFEADQMKNAIAATQVEADEEPQS